MGSPNFPSIQTFFSREVRTSNPGDSPSKNQHISDGFTSSEINEVLDPSTIDSNLPRAYQPCSILLLEAGPRHYEISGRIVNFSTQARKRQNPEESVGFWNLTVSDGTGIIGVNVHCRRQSEYQPLLGQRVTIFASFIGVNVGGEYNHTPCSTAIYPGCSSTTHITFHNASDGDELARTPLGLNPEEANRISGLMTLQEFINTGHEYEGAKLLVLVRSIGIRKTIRARKHEIPVNLVEVGVFDHTASTMLTLWAEKIPSATRWIPNETILLITKPVFSTGKQGSRWEEPRVGIGRESLVEVDPTFQRADWLRSTTRRLRQKESFFIPFPSEFYQNGHEPVPADRMLYTIAEIEERIVSEEASSNFTGKLNVLIFQVALLECWRLQNLCFTECCGIPLAANSPEAPCKNCRITQRLYMNPRVIKAFIDESGCLAGSKLVWCENAWKQLFIPDANNESSEASSPAEESWQQILELKTCEVREYEEGLLYSRVTLSFGWSASIQRLCVLGVEW